MYKQLPSALPSSVLRTRYNPHYRNMFIRTLMKMMGYNEDTGFLPVIEEFDKRLVFTLRPGETQTNSFQSNAEYWVCVDRSATLSLNVGGLNPIAFPTPDNIKVSSWFESAKDGTKVTVCEDGPINILFGSGEWQNSTMFPEKFDSINNRIWSLANESEFDALIVLNFKFVRVCRNIAKEVVLEEIQTVPSQPQAN